MTVLEQFIQDKLNELKDTSDYVYQECLFNEAFGAIELACLIYPEHEDEIADWWNDNKWKEFIENMGD